jgi:uncharacterized membrane protein YeaQ/YmgE (transglycosylase-associated protein family)
MIPYGWFELALDVVLSPGLWLSVLLAAIYSLLFSIWRWLGWGQLGRDVLAGLLGFAVGQLIGTLVGFDLGRIGQVQLLLGTTGTVALLAVGRAFRRTGERA